MQAPPSAGIPGGLDYGQSMRVAAVDLGTNTTRLLVADVAEGHVDEVVRREAITRLGEDVDRRRILLPTAIARVRNVLVDYRREAVLLGAERVLAVGTSAVRDADNGEAFLGEVEWSYGFTTRLLTGEEEAKLTLEGVGSGSPLGSRTLVVDVGGGSTELVALDAAGIVSAVSTEAGSVRLTERFLHSDPPHAEELAACEAHVRSLLPRLSVERAIGVAGTVTTAAKIEREGALSVHGDRLTRDSISATLDRLAALPLAERERVHGLASARAPVIVAGLIVVNEILGFYGLGELTVSERDLLHGAALAAAELPAPDENGVHPGVYTCC
jgi:exopolyphosphatase/guanosine-5'-triphosphate,3'-diphosphate pyrophosphatase